MATVKPKERISVLSIIGAKRVQVALVLPVTVGMLAAGCGGSGGATMPGSALLARVRAAYLHVPAVEENLRLGGLRGTAFLRHGVVVAAEGVVTVGTDPTLFAKRNGPVYGRRSASGCWKVVQSAYRRSLDVGVRFPHIAKIRPKTAHRTGNAWLLPFVAHGVKGTMRIDATTLLVQRVTVFNQPRTVVEHYRALRRAPALPTLRPRCK